MASKVHPINHQNSNRNNDESASQFESSSTGGSSFSSLTGKSFVTSTATGISSFITTLRVKESMVGSDSSYMFMYMVFYHAYLIYNSIIVSSVTTPLIADSYSSSETLWGVIPGWIWRSLYFPLNLACEFYPYHVIISLSAFFLIAQLLICIAIYYCKWASRKGGKLFERVKSFIFNVLIVQRTFTLFIISIHSILLSPNISNGSSYYFPSESWSSILQIVFMAIGSIGLIVNIVLTIIATYLTVETSSQLNRRVLFSLFNISPFMLFNLVNQLSLIATITCPSQYSFIASILKIVMNAMLLIVMLRTLPFFRKWENCLYVSLISLKTFTPISPLILQFISNQQDQQLISGIMSAVTILIALISFGCSFIIVHLWINFKLKSIRKLIENKSETSNTCQLIDQSKKRQDNLILFIRFALSSNKSKNKTDEGSDFDLAKHSVNNFSKSIENAELLLVSALFVSFGGIDEYEDSQSFSIGLALLQKAQRTSPSLIQLFNLMLRNDEIEFHAFHGNNLEILRKLANVEKKVKSLSRCHKSFFKELLNDKPSIDKLENINRISCSIYNECDSIYDNLLLSNRNNKTLLRSYASYLEKYKWEINLARDLFEEAQDNEDDKKNKSLVHLSRAFNSSIRESFSIKEISNSNRLSMDLKDKDNWDSVSVNEEENEENRKETLLRTAINTPMSTSVYSVAFTLFCLLSVSSIFILAPVALSFSASITERLAMQEKVCLMTSVPYKLITQIRALQSEYTLHGQVPEELLNSTIENTLKVLSTVNSVVSAGDSNQLMPEVAKEYLKNQYPLQIPMVNSSLYNTSISPNYRSANTSIQFYLSSISTHGQTLFNQYNNLSVLTHNLDTNYPFLFLYYNRLTMTTAFNDFCSKFIDESVQVLDTNFNYLLAVMISVAGVYITLSIMYIVVLGIHTKRMRVEMKEIFRKIAKDEIGKVFHSFDKKIDDTIGTTSSSMWKASFIVLSGSIALCFVVCVCLAMVGLEFDLNSEDSKHSMVIIADINIVSLRTSRTNFRLIELIWRPKYHHVSYPIVNEQNKDDLLDLRTYWNYVVVGQETTNYQSVVFGKYEDIDSILSDTCNSTTSVSPENPCRALTALITDYISKALDYNEIFFDHTQSSDEMSYTYLSNVFYITQTITGQLNSIVSELVQHDHNSISVTISMLVLCVVATAIYAFICYMALRKYWRERACLRMMLNYINLELIDNNLILKDYVMSNTVPSSKLASRILSKFETSNESEDKIEMVKTILNGGVDSAIICDKDGNITIFNNSAEEMFGYSRSQVLGLSIQSLFTNEYSQRITKLISTGESHDSFEAIAMRKNKTSFSSKVSVSISIHEKKQILIVFIRDISTEKKQGILIAEEKKKSEDLLLNILPISMASRLKNGEENLYEKVNDITVFFSDMVGFTAWSSKLQPSELVQILNLIVQGFDKLTEIHMIDKIKTIGDAYFCVSGLHSSKSSDHPERMLKFAIEIMAFLKNINKLNNISINLRIGIHTGDAVGGVIGFKKFAYDLWGDTINTASRMESTSLPGRIQISRSTYGRVYDLFEFEERMIEVKGKGLSQCYLLKEKHHDSPLDSNSTTVTLTSITEQTSSNNLPTTELIDE